MVKIEDYHYYLDELSRIKSLKTGFITNCYLDKAKVDLWISNGFLYLLKDEESFFLLKKNTGFFSLYFFSTTESMLKQTLASLLLHYENTTFVIDILGKERESTIIQSFTGFGFQRYQTLVRMNRLGEIKDLKAVDTAALSEATIEDLPVVSDLLDDYFDPLAEQIPLPAEIEEWINKGQILVYKEGNKIVGFIIYDLNGGTLYLRYWFVHPDFREKKIGSKLFNYFYSKGAHTKRQLFWVIESNENAIKRYKHYGFQEEKMFDLILIKKGNI